jgi:O-antigen ligase
MLYWQRFNIFALCFFAISVSLGAALVSISKALVIFSFILYIICSKPWRNFNNLWSVPQSLLVVCFATAWICVTIIWSDVDTKEMGAALNRHARLLLIPVVYYLIPNRQVCYGVLACLSLSQLMVVCLSFLMFFGIHIPLTQTKQPFEFAVPFTSSLEQPVMSTLVVVLLWYFKNAWAGSWIRYSCYVAIGLCAVNVFFIMLGRTGFLLMLFAIGIVCYLDLPKKYKALALFAPLVLGYLLFYTSTRLHEKTMQINDGITKYEAGDYDTSEGQRLDYWRRSFQSIQETPVIGKGVGSWKNEYQRLGGLQTNPPSNPHNQFLLWWVEFGGVGLLFLLTFFISIYKDSQLLYLKESRALICITSLAIVMSLFNCPFYGVGMGEFFMILFGTLLATGKASQASMQLPKVPSH